MSRAPRDSSNYCVKRDGAESSSRRYLPDSQRLVGGDGGQPLATHVQRETAHHVGVTVVAHGDMRRKGPEIFRTWKLGKQTVGIDVHPLLQRPGHQVQVETPLETFGQQLLVARHVPQGVELLRDVTERPILLVLILPRLLLLLREEILLGRVVRLVMSWERRLGRGQRPWCLAALRCLVGPQVPHFWGWWRRRPYLTLAQQGHKPLHVHSLPLGRQEAPLRRMLAAQRVDLRLGIVELHEGGRVRRNWVHAFTNPANDLQVRVS
mmetsp:Transcript_13340/g.36677  ORF Transcript_13340/g.36677 Transcript_13340/m.36677 type:complete len:265 (-) Transcript_13340:594-1388(-)